MKFKEESNMTFSFVNIFEEDYIMTELIGAIGSNIHSILIDTRENIFDIHGIVNSLAPVIAKRYFNELKKGKTLTFKTRGGTEVVFSVATDADCEEYERREEQTEKYCEDFETRLENGDFDWLFGSDEYDAYD